MARLITKWEDQIPSFYNWARYVRHIGWGRTMGYPRLTRSIFRAIDSKNLGAIDVGANKGVFTRYLSKHFATTLAIEPLPHLAGRIARLDLPGVTVYQYALGNAEQDIVLRIPLDETGEPVEALASALDSNKFSLWGHGHHPVSEIVVPQRRLASLVDMGVKIGFIKIDVEGFENEVLRGSKELIERDQPLILLEICRGHNPDYQQTFSLMHSLGYHAYTALDDGLRDSAIADIEAQPLDATARQSGANNASPHWDFLFFPEHRREEFSSLLV